MQDWLFYHKHLEKVSRSFSFCIAQLPSPQREWIALSYLLFRIADTIEDSNWQNQEQQFEKFSFLQNALEHRLTMKELDYWLKGFPDDINKGESLLLADLNLLLDDFYQLPSLEREQLRKNINQMMHGMMHFLKHHQIDNELTLSSDKQLNQYCFFVAGLVGELLTVFFSSAFSSFNITDEVLLNSFHFGLFLQKINILKDQLVDEKLGRKFMPSRKNVRESVEEHAIKAFEYIKSLPIEAGRAYRIFCGWSLFIGLASIKWIDKSYIKKKAYKISYAETMSIVVKVKINIDSNKALEKMFNSYLSMIKKDNSSINSDSSGTKVALPGWFSKIYPSKIVELHAHELGLSGIAD